MMSDAKTQAMLNALAAQRDQAANALVEQIGVLAQVNAEWAERWSDQKALEARLEELGRGDMDQSTRRRIQPRPA